MAIGRPINSNGPLGIRTVGFTATAGQTEFTVPGGYTVNNIDVFRNGVKLTQQSDYQALDEVKVVLSTAAQLNDEVTIKIYSKFDVANAIVGAASSQVIDGDLVITGTLYNAAVTSGGGAVGAAGTWTNFDGITGVTTSKKVRIQNDLQVTGVGTFGSLSSGVITGTTVTGTTASFSGNVSIGGTLTYDDVTNVDSVGVITARDGINVTSGGINITSGGIDVTSGGITVTGITTADAFVGHDYLRAPFGTTVNYTVTVAAKTAAHRYNGSGSSNGYVIDGVESPFLTLTPGRTYRFTLSSGDMTSHPFRFYLDADRTTQYTTNVTSTSTYTEIVVTDSTPAVLHYQCSAHSLMGNAVNTNSGSSTTSETSTFYGGLVEKYEKAGTTLGSQPVNPLTDGNVILFTGNESGNLTINFTGVHSELADGETCSFTVILTPNGSGVINVVQVDGQAITVKWSGGSVPTAGASGQDVYTFQILKTGTGTSDYTVFGAATNYA